jgi:hypothetical protein
MYFRNSSIREGQTYSKRPQSRGIYNWKQEHNFTRGIILCHFAKSRNGDDGVIHNFDFGDDYFTREYRPFDQYFGKRTVGNNSTVTITKLWETASLTGALRKGFTPSFGMTGVSDTGIQLAERLSGNAAVEYSLYDTEDINIKTFQGSAGLQYISTTWLYSNLCCIYRRSTAARGAAKADLLSRDNVNGNSVFLSIMARFDLWPNTGWPAAVVIGSLSRPSDAIAECAVALSESVTEN